VNTGFQIATKIALGADMCNAARAMMFALGCIQALRCNTNRCPSLKSFVELLGAAGLHKSSEIGPRHIMRRFSPTDVRPYHKAYEFLEEGALLHGTPPESFADDWAMASAEAF
jgi:hypothetical protein